MCTECARGFNLMDGKCFRQCEINYFPSSDGSMCEKCPDGCEACTKKDKCTKCSANKYLLNGQCYDFCPLNYYGRDSACFSCYPSCETCLGPEKTDCLSCHAGFKYDSNNKECQSTCPDGTFYDTSFNECNVCNSSNCKSCIRTPNTCTKCHDSMALDLSTFTCKPCCTRSIRGKIKLNCCNCPRFNFNGFCLMSNQTSDNTVFEEIIDFMTVKQSSTGLKIMSIIFILVSLLLIFYSTFLLKEKIFQKFKKSETSYAQVRYSVLDANDQNEEN
jgi:hypothetical protein